MVVVMAGGGSSGAGGIGALRAGTGGKGALRAGGNGAGVRDSTGRGGRGCDGVGAATAEGCAIAGGISSTFTAFPDLTFLRKSVSVAKPRENLRAFAESPDALAFCMKNVILKKDGRTVF